MIESSDGAISDPEDAVRAIQCPQSRLVAEMALPNRSAEEVESRLALMEAWLVQQGEVLSVRTTTWPNRAVLRMTTKRDADLEQFAARFANTAASYELPFEVRTTTTPARNFMVIVHGNVDESTLQNEARRIQRTLPTPSFSLGLFDRLVHLVVSSESLNNFEITRHEVAEKVRDGLQGRVVGEDELGKLEIIRGRGGFVVTVSDVARITDNRDAVTVVSFQGRPAVAFGYSGSKDEINAARKSVQAAVNALKKSTPVNVGMALTPTLTREFCAPAHDRLPELRGAFLSRAQVDASDEESTWRVFGELDSVLADLGAPALSVVGPVPAFLGDSARSRDITTLAFSQDMNVRSKLNDWFARQPAVQQYQITRGPQTLAVMLLGDELDTLNAATERLVGVGRGLWTTREEIDRLIPSVRERATRRWRISESDVLGEFSAAVKGVEVGVAGKDKIPVRLVSEEANGEKSITQIVQGLSYPSPRGKLVPFTEILEVKQSLDQRIEHLNGRRVVVVLWPVKDREALQKSITSVTDRYPSVQVEVIEPPAVPKD